jgi:hypothetical protein
MISDLETAPERISRALRGTAFMPARSLRQRGDVHRALVEPAVQADEANIGRFAGGLIDRLAVINRRDELRADLVGELVFFDVGARDRELLERRVLAFEFDRGEFLAIAQAVLGRFLRQRRRNAERAQRRDSCEPHAHGRAALAFSS